MQKNTFEILEQNLDKKAAQINSQINLISSYFKVAGFDAINDLDSHLEILKANLGNDTFDFSNIIIADLQGKIIFATQPCSTNNCSIRHRDYFKQSLQNPNIVHQGKLVEGIISNTQAIPFSKALEYNDTIYGIIIIGLDTKDFYSSLIRHKYLNFKASSLKPMEDDHKIYTINQAISKPLCIELNNTVYELGIIPNKEFYLDFFKFILPWDIVFLVLVAIFLKIQKGKNKMIALYRQLFSSSQPEIEQFQNNSLSDSYEIASDILIKVSQLIKDYRFNISNVEKIVEELIKEVSQNELETAHLGQEIIDLINDKSINLNEEYITTLKELHINTADNIYIINSLLTLLKQNLYSLKDKKGTIKLNDLKLNLTQFLKFKCSESDWTLKVYVQPFYQMIDLINAYFDLKNEHYSSEVEITTLEDSRILLTFSGVPKNINNLTSTKLRNEILYYYKIKLLAQINFGNVELFELEDKLTLTLEFPLEIQDKQFSIEENIKKHISLK
ncbi:hypothetical protein I862_04215 [endosymbiont of Acanthamoeba sp. UWC8]|uniref:PDC sensor domain-containing protein n=1 Tax=endosymbiont of Acanthamoeba sp. UWC8 TaxID=86106 RepID=UPI0004D0DABA|nr:hypothetical protein [endosymbiont of Acanthamoeba sp. UWC8]AIF81403.1 hypothetical protein I862_04215 [endosymbiont of Acanthamoeba sp. UWC8]